AVEDQTARLELLDLLGHDTTIASSNGYSMSRTATVPTRGTRLQYPLEINAHLRLAFVSRVKKGLFIQSKET
ncbi:hypothetical protein PFISCL1PPCAC_25372, partial [Pristionchus fissidentatus]